VKGLVALFIAGSLVAQQPGAVTGAGAQVWTMPGEGGITTGYRMPRVEHLELDDSPRLGNLLRNGNLYLSLQDAIALALENNLDLELERYGIRLADSDVLRTKSGALPRGVPLSIREAPPGLGAPQLSSNGTLGGGDTPALNALIGPGVQVDLSILGSVPLPTGVAVPNLDPQLVGMARWDHASDIQNSIFVPTIPSLNSEQTTANIAYQQGFTTGGSFEAFFNNSRVDTNSPLVLYNPYTGSNFGINFKQPLLRGFGLAANRRYIRIARNNRQVSDSVFKQQVIATVAGIVRLYWDLASLREDVRVRQDAVNSADQFVRDTRNQVEAGTAANVDVSRAQAELARRQRDLAVARSLVEQQSTVIKDYLTRGNLDSDLVSAPIITTDALAVPDNTAPAPLDTLIKQALRLRPEPEQAHLQLTNSELSLQGSKSGLRPALDLVATAQNNGLSGNLIRATGVTGDMFLMGGYGDALSQVVHNSFPNYGVGVQLTVPLLNRAARSDVIRDELTVRQQEIRIRQLEKQIRLDVTNASIAVEQARATYEATRSERIAQEATLSAEQEKLDAGASTSYEVLVCQRDLAAARSAEISALASYQKAKAALERATGTILIDYHIELAEALTGTVNRISAPPPSQHP
jgi:outer membrane protein TolC